MCWSSGLTKPRCVCCRGSTGNFTYLPFSGLHFHTCLLFIPAPPGAASSVTAPGHPWCGHHEEPWLLLWLTSLPLNLNPTFGALGSVQLMWTHPDHVLWVFHTNTQYLNTPSALCRYFLIPSCSQLSVASCKLRCHLCHVFSWSFIWQSSVMSSF